MTNHTISRVNYQTSISERGVVSCALCEIDIPYKEATAGPCDSYGELTFLCNNHLRDPRQFINFLADFMTAQRMEFVRNLKDISEGTPDAWFLH
jgi:hypothetical protein